EQEVINRARARLMDSRNLCEDFLGVTVIGRQQYILCAEIDLDHRADVNDVQARIFNELQKYLTPTVRFYSLREMIAKGYRAEEIFEGPVLTRGFIDGEELKGASLKKTIQLSDLISIIMAIDGVRSVRDFRLALLTASGETVMSSDPWTVDVPQGKQAVLNLEKSRLVFYKDVHPFRGDTEKVGVLLSALREQERAGQRRMTEDIPIPPGTYRDPASYRSIQNDFPKNYGIGRAGLPESSSETRKAQAKQLKAYVLFFDQVLANCFAQLAHVRDLFSFDRDVRHTYFSQTVKDFEGSDAIYADAGNMETRLQDLTEQEKSEGFYERRNRFLDHLLARFSENFSEYVSVLYSTMNGQGRDKAIRTKADFLKDYGETSSGRASSFNYGDEEHLWDTENVTGLERRLARLLGIENFRRRNLARIKYEVYPEKDADTMREYRFRVIDEASGKILLSSSTRYLEEQKAIDEMRKALTRAMTREGFGRNETTDHRFYFNIVDEDRNVVARRIEYFRTAEEREAAIDFLVDFLVQRYSDEGLFVVEHILLRPKTKTDALLPVCTGSGCSNGQTLDPYSFRVTFVLPAYSPRFYDGNDPEDPMKFRRFVEKTIRLETPAHIVPRICWINQTQMADFEDAYRKWLQASAGGSGTERSVSLRRLIDVMSTLKNVYPAAGLYECTEPSDGKRTFVLDSTTLGIQEE
ncbi:MAG TPA: hypothetical protein VN260_01840, partial [Dissulfurispiraceae bacterium]|nr:hypothetical protein [Dissulfurispiraceae bacterium]